MNTLGQTVAVLIYRPTEPQLRTPLQIGKLRPCGECKTPTTSRKHARSDAEIWQSIHIKYLETRQDLHQFCSSVQLCQPFPDVLLINHLDDFFKDCPASRVRFETIQTHALLYETAQFLHAQHHHGKHLRLLVTGITTPDLTTRSLYTRWFDLLMRIRPEKNDATGAAYVLTQDIAYPVSTVFQSQLQREHYKFPLTYQLRYTYRQHTQGGKSTELQIQSCSK